MSAHTPGPWYFADSEGTPQGYDYTGPGYYLNPGIFAPDGTRIVGCDEYDVFYPSNFDRKPDSAEKVANVRLLVASPKMLALLQELVAIEGPQPGTADWAQKARAVIHEATEGAPQ